MHLASHATWTISFGRDEFLLLTKALRGVLKEEEKERARRLGNDITVAKAKFIKHLCTQNAKLIENLKAAAVWDEESTATEEPPHSPVFVGIDG